MKTKIKHKARNIHPRIAELASEIGLPIFRRDKELWLDGDLQLTYRKRIVNGDTFEADDADRVLMAVGILERILEARQTWGTVAERQARIIAGLEAAVPKYQRMTYTYHREPTLDCGWMFRCVIETRWDMGIDLCGQERIRVSGATAESCLEQLRKVASNDAA